MVAPLAGGARSGRRVRVAVHRRRWCRRVRGVDERAGRRRPTVGQVDGGGIARARRARRRRRASRTPHPGARWWHRRDRHGRRAVGGGRRCGCCRRRAPRATRRPGRARVGNATYVFGGANGDAMLADILRTTDGITFTRVGTLPVPVRYPALAVVGHCDLPVRWREQLRARDRHPRGTTLRHTTGRRRHRRATPDVAVARERGRAPRVRVRARRLRRRHAPQRPDPALPSRDRHDDRGRCTPGCACPTPPRSWSATAATSSAARAPTALPVATVTVLTPR